jgi:N-acetylglucosaminyldiphosphoundecaprenol N-acetyl-beta-D-mannosaminyltransferase
LDIPLYNQNISEACAYVISVITSGQAKENRLVSATGAHGLVYARKNPGFKQILDDFHINLPDGMPGVWVGRLKGARQMRRCYGPDFFKGMMQASAHENIKHFFCGGNDGVADALLDAVSKKFGNTNVTGTFCPPFLPVEKYDYRAIAGLIETSKADIVWIGLSTPKQELFAKNLSAFTSVHFIMTVGAAFDFHTNKVRQAPSVLQNMGLEWLFRLVMEPKRLYKRYLEIVPLFIYYNMKEMLTFASRKS